MFIINMWLFCWSQGEHIDDKRPKYMDTRDLEDMMEDLIFDALKDVSYHAYAAKVTLKVST